MKEVPLTIALLSERDTEVREYLEFLRVAVERRAVLVAKDGGLNLILSLELTHTLKANLLLLLYSAMEATLVQLLDEMHDAIGTNCNSVDALNAQLLHLVIRTVKKDNPENVLLPGKPLHESLFKYWISEWKSRTTGMRKRADGISGSVDSKVFYQQLRKFGVLSKTDNDCPPPHLTNPALQKIKTTRNELAHGEKSFTDLGRNLAVESLAEDAVAVFDTLGKITGEVNQFLSERRYLAQPFFATALSPAALANEA